MGGKLLSRFALFLLCLPLCLSAKANDKLAEVHWVTDNWPGFTQEDGTGLYDQIFQHVFKSQNVTLKKTYAPFKRVLRGIDNKRFDFGGGVLKEDTPHPKHIQAPFPVMTNQIFAFGKLNILQDEKLFTGDLKDLTICATHMFDEAAHLKGKLFEVHSKKMAFNMAVLGRCDLFVDDRRTIEEVIKQESPEIDSFANLGFGAREVGRFSAYMISPRTSRGEKVMNAYVNGTLKTFKEGSLAEIYHRLGFIVPDELIAYSQRDTSQILSFTTQLSQRPLPTGLRSK